MAGLLQRRSVETSAWETPFSSEERTGECLRLTAPLNYLRPPEPLSRRAVTHSCFSWGLVQITSWHPKSNLLSAARHQAWLL